MKHYLIGYDIGGTKTEAALLELEKSSDGVLPIRGKTYKYKILSRERVATEREKGYESILKKMRLLFEKMLTSLPSGAEIDGVGFGLPGAIDPRTGNMLNGNTSAFVGHELRSDFSSIFSPIQKLEIANDANCFALAEALCGAGLYHLKESGKPIEDHLAIGVILGTGCGAGIVVDGKFIEGVNGGAGEMGHTLLVSDGRKCFCGRTGCAEIYVSGTGLEMEYAEISGRPRGTFNGAEVFALAEKGDASAERAVERYCYYLSMFLANMTNVLDPDYFVLGGGVSLQDRIYKNLQEEVKAKLFLPVEAPPIYKNRLGDSAGVIGAAVLPFIRHDFT